MKKYLILPALTFLIGCAETETPEDFTLISGTLENYADAPVVLLDGENNPKLIEIQEGGVFTDTLEINNAGYYSLRVGRSQHELFITPGDDVKFTLDASTPEATPMYSGSAAAVNTYLIEKEAMNPKDLEVLFKLEETAFLTEIDRLKSEQKALLDASGVSQTFKTLETQGLVFEYLGRKQDYPSYHRYFAGKEDFEPSEEFLSDLKELDLDNNAAAIQYRAYRGIAFAEFSESLQDADSSQTMIQNVISAVDKVKSPRLKDHYITNMIYFFNSNDDQLEVTKDALLAQATGDALKKKIATKYNKIKLLTKGNPSPTFDYENYEGGKTALADLKGDYVYIDVWATWCGPCIGEIPSLKAMEKEFEDSKIKFVSISIDEKPAYETWRKMIADRELGGTQLMSDNAWQSQFVKDYAIEGIPRFIILDPDGNIVSADAKRPSNPELTAQFEALGL